VVATVVLVHGLWLTPRSWELWAERYARQGHRVLTPAYPGLEGEVEALRDDPTPLDALTPERTLAHLASIVAGLDRPIVIGHSFGGVLVRSLRGLFAAGVALHALPAAGGGRAGSVPLSPQQFHYALANAMDADESARLHARYAIPAPASWAWDSPPGDGLLEVAGDEDNLVAPARGAVVFPGRCHFTLVQDGWEDVADRVLEWALRR
jgi:pimeloyl-ACP methyl ester carboxylesterase